MTLSIVSGALTVNGAGGASITAWGFTDTNTAKFPGPAIVATEGDTLAITVNNTHSIDHNFVIPGLQTDVTAIPPGGSRTYQIKTTTAGTYFYYDSLNNVINREMGLYGALIVSPNSMTPTVWNNGPAFDFQRTWVVSEMDKPNWNDAIASNQTIDTTRYKPNYFIINGMGGFDAMNDVNTKIEGNVGQVALVRIINTGQFTHSLHFHGNHVQVLRVNNIVQSSPYKRIDVVSMPPLSTMDVLYPLNQTGKYPMHIHTAQMETANGVYLNGVATMIIMH